MIPLLSTIVSIYCVLRLVEMVVAEGRREKEVKNGGLCELYIFGAVVIIFLCIWILCRSEDLSKMMSA